MGAAYQVVDIEQSKVGPGIAVRNGDLVRRAVLVDGVDRAYRLQHPLVPERHVGGLVGPVPVRGDTAGAEIGVYWCQVEREKVDEHEEAAARSVQLVELGVDAVHVRDQSVARHLAIGQVRVVANVVGAVEHGIYGVRGGQRRLEVALAGARVNEGFVGKKGRDLVKLEIGEGCVDGGKKPGALEVAANSARDGVVVKGQSRAEDVVRGRPRVLYHVTGPYAATI